MSEIGLEDSVENAARPDHRLTAWMLVALALLAPFLGGSTELWAQAIIATLTGLLFVCSPPRKSLGRFPTLLFVGVGAVPLIAFLPAQWFPAPDWRAAISALGIHLPQTLTPQPWITVESCCLLWLGLGWAYYLFTFRGSAGFREQAWNAFCFGILCLAALVAFGYATKIRLPFWPEVREFGFFPNRNQTGNVLALGGIIMYANAFQHLQRGRRIGWLWMAGLALVCWALILNFSRAGIILFFCGALVWNIWWMLRAKETPISAFGPLAILVALFVFAGGETLLRFSKESVDTLSSQGGRLLIYRDAIGLLRDSAFLGIGLGNFRAISSGHRHFYTAQNETIHPESDWLWTGVEIGILAPLIIFVLIAWWFRNCFPFDAGSWRRLRMAATIAGCAFVVHGFFDVSGHRIGALWPALFVAGTALHPQLHLYSSRLTPVIFRLFGIFLISVGTWWMTSMSGLKTLPTSATLAQAFTEINRAADKDNYQRMLESASAGLKIAPLNWELYFKRGFAEAALIRPRAEVLRDFAAARFLLPNWPDLYLREGRVWLALGEPDFAFDVWRDGMQRLGVETRRFYRDIYGLVRANPDLRDRWRELGQLRKDCVLVFFENATPTEFRLEVDRLLSEDPHLRSLSPSDLKVLFQLWYERGDKLALAEALKQNPEWQSMAWRELARALADNQDYRQAYETVAQFLMPPRLPKADPKEPIETTVARFRSSGMDEDGLVLARVQADHDQVDDAVAMLQLLGSKPQASAAVYYLEAQLWASKSDWQKAWQAMAKYLKAAKQF